MYVKYRADGMIVSMVEVMGGQYTADRHPFIRVGDDEQVALIVLPKKLATRRVAALRSAYQVKTSGAKPSLVLKK